MDRNRCPWADASALSRDYHDREWGVPVHEDNKLFEMLILEGAQAGLAWATILTRREGYRRAFQKFDPERVARFDARKVEALVADPGIVRNRAKIEAAIHNARCFLDVQERFGSFDQYAWQFVGGKPRQNGWKSLQLVPASTIESDAMSKELKKLGFKFVGTTICYAFIQAVGMVNDHVVDCYRWEAIRRLGA
ncbi:MAG: DNA-3-methyladenine glycosylase I [Betaproteobacteria bacterium]|nr:DNA-3-methyladenine glycosylase I [Betaproteobacteria bacterium]